VRLSVFWRVIDRDSVRQSQIRCREAFQSWYRGRQNFSFFAAKKDRLNERREQLQGRGDEDGLWEELRRERKAGRLVLFYLRSGVTAFSAGKTLHEAAHRHGYFLPVGKLI
jgi:hypothetical protein